MAVRRRRREVHLSIRLYPGQDDELIRWLEQFDGRPHGVKSQAVREALCQGIKPAQGQAAAAPALDLAELRQVVEAAIASALARFEGQVIGAAVATSVKDDETEEILNALGAALVLGADE